MQSVGCLKSNDKYLEREFIWVHRLTSRVDSCFEPAISELSERVRFASQALHSKVCQCDPAKMIQPK